MPALPPGTDPVEVTVPICIIAFDRPDYLRRLCLSLKAQRGVRIAEERIHLIQDGSRSPRSGIAYGDPEKIAASIAIFQEIFPGGVVHASPDNLGIALNILRAEKLVFVKEKAKIAYFFEDDLELGPFYIAMMETLRRQLQPHANVGYFAAYGRHLEPGNPDAPALVPMGHLWGFGLTRQCWMAMQPLLKPFFDIYSRIDYTAKPHLAILSLYKNRPVSAGITSQDAARTTACAELGFARVMTDVCYARYIGETGVNFRPEVFASHGFDRMTATDHMPAKLPEATADVIAEIAMHQHFHANAHRRTEFEAILAQYEATTFLPDKPITREEALWLYRLIVDRVPKEDALEKIVGVRSVRQVRRALLKSREAAAKCWHMT